MKYSKVSSKGQVTLPVEARNAVGIKPHDRVIIEVGDHAILIRPTESFFELKGFLGKPHPREKELMVQAASRKPRE
jgi:AbrB family looped-hinge helix DNA binding protein